MNKVMEVDITMDINQVLGATTFLGSFISMVFHFGGTQMCVGGGVFE